MAKASCLVFGMSIAALLCASVGRADESCRNAIRVADGIMSSLDLVARGLLKDRQEAAKMLGEGHVPAGFVDTWRKRTWLAENTLEKLTLIKNKPEDERLKPPPPALKTDVASLIQNACHPSRPKVCRIATSLIPDTINLHLGSILELMNDQKTAIDSASPPKPDFMKQVSDEFKRTESQITKSVETENPENRKKTMDSVRDSCK